MESNRVELQTRKNEIERLIDSLEAEIGTEWYYLGEAVPA